MAACDFHLDRPALGVCMRCRALICADCCTRVDDINHCHACLKNLAAKPAPPQARSAFAAVCVLLLACLYFFGVFWLAQGSLSP
jgi:hypothetical protein